MGFRVGFKVRHLFQLHSVTHWLSDPGIGRSAASPPVRAM